MHFDVVKNEKSNLKRAKNLVNINSLLTDQFSYDTKFNMTLYPLET